MVIYKMQDGAEIKFDSVQELQAFLNKSTKWKPYTSEEDEFIVNNAAFLTQKEIARALNRSLPSLKNHLQDMRKKTPLIPEKAKEYLEEFGQTPLRLEEKKQKEKKQKDPVWTREQDEFLMENYHSMPAWKLGSILNKTIRQVSYRLNKLRPYQQPFFEKKDSHEKVTEYGGYIPKKKNKRYRKKWKKWEDSVLRRLYSPGKKVDWELLTQLLPGRTKMAITKRVRTIGIVDKYHQVARYGWKQKLTDEARKKRSDRMKYIISRTKSLCRQYGWGYDRAFKQASQEYQQRSGLGSVLENVTERRCPSCDIFFKRSDNDSLFAEQFAKFPELRKNCDECLKRVGLHGKA